MSWNCDIFDWNFLENWPTDYEYNYATYSRWCTDYLCWYFDMFTVRMEVYMHDYTLNHRHQNVYDS